MNKFLNKINFFKTYFTPVMMQKKKYQVFLIFFFKSCCYYVIIIIYQNNWGCKWDKLIVFKEVNINFYNVALEMFAL